MQGTAAMMLQTGSHPAVLKDAVTSESLPFTRRAQYCC